MLRRAEAAAAAALGLWLYAGAASAQTDVSLNRAGSGARAAGMGDAFVAVSDDGTAASWNPAGLAQLRQPEFSLVYGVTDRRLEYSALRSLDERFAYTSHGAGGTSGSIDFASAALPFQVGGTAVTLQAGWQRLYQLTAQIGGATDRVSLADPSLPPTHIDRSDRLQGDINLLSIASSVKVTGRLSVGASFNFWRGDWNERVALIEQPGTGEPTGFFNAISRDRIRGHNLTVGLLLAYPSWNVGLVHHAPFWSDYSTHGQVYSSRTPARQVDIGDARFRLPRSIGFGVARRLPARWTLAASATADDWTDAVVDRVPGIEGPINFFDGQPPEITSSRDTISVNLGVEHLLVREGSVIPLRMGFGWEPQGAMDPVTRDPVDYHLVAAGAGYNTNSFKLDLAVQLRWSGIEASAPLSVETLVRGGIPPDATGRASAREWRVKVSAIYRLADTEKLGAFLRRVFG
jgi:long-subunit fatty acid transport protein